jgi:hypothetical protein
MKKAIIWLIAIVVVSLAGFYYGYDNQEKPFGSVAVGNDYSYTNMSAPTASTTMLQAGVGTLGSVIVVATDDALFTLKNGTSTTDLTATTIAEFKASVGEGTYTFDAIVTEGLLVTTADKFNGQYIVTYRK